MSKPSKPVVLIAEKLAPSVLSVFGDEVEVRHVDGTDRSALLEAVKSADALLVRSATKVDAEVLGATTQLKVVARAGVGLDNVEVPAATERGVLVVNAPTSNIVSAAEHAVALLLSVARRVPAADQSLRGGEWKRSSFSGVELQGKTVGVVGLGKIGQLFAQRLAAFDTKLIAYDPYVSAARAAQLGIELVTLDELLSPRRRHLHPPAEDAGDQGPHRRRGAEEDQAGRHHRERRARRADRRAGPGRRAALGPRRRRRRRRLRHRADHVQPAVRAGERRRHAAPGRLHRRGAGPRGHRRREVGAAGAARRLRAGRGQRLRRWRGRRARPPVPVADPEAGHAAHRAEPEGAEHGRRRGQGRDLQRGHRRAAARRAARGVHRRGRGPGHLRQRAAARREARCPGAS